MLKGILNYIEKINTEGLHWPFLFDPTTKKPSVTLMFMYITFIMTVVSVGAAHFFPSMIPATILSIAFWVLSVVFYRMRRLDDLSVNLKTGAIEVKDNEKRAETPVKTEGDDQ